MLSALRRGVLCAVVSVGLTSYAVASLPDTGKPAAYHARYLATQFPGRMTGTQAERLAAEYLRQQFWLMGYQSDIRKLDVRYRYRKADKSVDWQLVEGNMVIAGKKGDSPYQIIIMAHFDTFAPQNDADTKNNLGGPEYQGYDDNASGVGVMLELAERLQALPSKHTLRFLATSGEEIGRFGSIDYVNKLGARNWHKTLLVINLDNLIVGDRLYFHSGRNTLPGMVKLTRDRALEIAAKKHIAATTNPGLNNHFPQGTGCCNDADSFDDYDIPVLSIEATNWSLGNFDGFQQVKKNKYFPDGQTWHNPELDNVDYIDKAMPGRTEKRSRDVVNILLPLITELLNSETLPSIRKSVTPVKNAETAQNNASTQPVSSVQNSASMQPAASAQNSASTQPAASAQNSASTQPAASAQNSASTQPAASVPDIITPPDDRQITSGNTPQLTPENSTPANAPVKENAEDTLPTKRR